MEFRSISILVSCLTLSGAATFAADEKPAAPAAKEPSGGGLLGGPAVDDDSTKGKDVFGEDMNKPGGKKEQAIRPRAWMKVLMELNLSDDQRSKIKPLTDEFQKQMREFEEAHGAELRDLEQKGKEARESGRPAKEFGAKIKALRDMMPNAQAHQEKIWALLTPEQQEFMRSRLAEAEQKGRQGERPRRAPDMEGAPPPPAGSAPPMDSPDGPMMEEPGPGQASPAMKERPRRDRARQNDNDQGLDDAARRRSKFLREHQSPSARPSAQPPKRERPFVFEEDAGNDLPAPPPRPASPVPPAAPAPNGG
jgi:Spy/CpxP family protein refolding chaperone